MTRLAIWIAVVGVALASLAAYLEWGRNIATAEEAMANDVDILTDSITFAFGEVVDQLVAIAGLYRASEVVDRAEFTRFVENFGVEAGVQGVSYAPKLHPADLPDYLAMIRATIPDFEIYEFDATGRKVPALPRETYVPLQWIHPEGPRESPHGFDLASYPVIAATLSDADDTGEVAASPFFRLPEGGDTDVIVLVEPIEPVDVSGVTGYAVALVDLDPFLKAHLPRGVDSAVTWELSNAGDRPEAASTDRTVSLDVAGDRWRLDVSASPGSNAETDPSSALYVLAAGVAASLLAAFGASAYSQRLAAGAEVERLRELSRAKDQFLASVGHELRTPLTGVVGFTSLLQDPNSELTEEERERMIESIAHESTDLAAIIDDLLVAARSELEMVTVTSEVVDLRRLVEGVLEVTREEKARGVSVVTDETEVLVIGDPARIRQIVRNLITNACRYGGEPIEVRLTRDDENILLQVADAGPGIPSDEWERIFEPYHRAHTVESMPAALGIGLSVSRHLGRLMGGDLIYRHENGWSLFELRLRAAKHAPRRALATDRSATTG